MQAKSDHKDAVLATKNAEIQITTIQRQVEILTNQNKKYQVENNKSTANAENVERELNTQKEIFSQYEKSKKETITRLQSELTVIEDKYKH
jgi:multidrug resistance efflux pump